MSISPMDIAYRFIEPLDVLFLRGNRLFGDPGSYGESLVPPWPSVAAGAIRSRMLLDDDDGITDLAAYGSGDRYHPTLGTPENPGSFMLTDFHLARKNADGKTEILIRPPADLVIGSAGSPVSQMAPLVCCPSLQSSFPLEQLPVLAQGTQRTKPQSGFWLSQDGWLDYLQGKVPTRQQLINSSDLWSIDVRVGIGLCKETRSVESGKLFTSQAVVMHKPENRIRKHDETAKTTTVDFTVGFLAGVSGAKPPHEGLLRFGGDGRAASISKAEQINLRVPDINRSIADAKRCRLVLTSPGLFPAGWKPSEIGADNRLMLPGGLTAKLVSAAVPRSEMVSGWDMARRLPKAARRVAPTGSVYWLEELETVSGSLEESLRKLVETGLWLDSCKDSGRRAEGFNRCALGAWELRGEN